MGEQFAAPES